MGRKAMSMKTLILELPDDVYERAARRASDRGSSLRQEAVEWLARYSGAGYDEALAVARTRMQELFRTVKGFRMTPKIRREDLYERGSFR
jgi:hypothetical protein